MKKKEIETEPWLVSGGKKKKKMEEQTKLRNSVRGRKRLSPTKSLVHCGATRLWCPEALKEEELSTKLPINNKNTITFNIHKYQLNS